MTGWTGSTDPTASTGPTASTNLAVPTGPAAPVDPTGPTAAPADPTGPTDPTGSPVPLGPPVAAVPEEESLPGSGDAGGGRPADVAREALRAARRQAKAEAAAEGVSAQGAAPARWSSRPAARQRPAGGPGTADARARAVRDFAAGAFRLPPEADQAEEPLPAGEQAGTSSAEGGATAHAEPAPSPGTAHAEPASSPGADTGQSVSAVRGRTVSSAPPAKARAPRSMAAPDRDGDLRRTFPALPPREAAAEGFAATWWGNAWVTALEEGALDAARLERGRGYAEHGHVDAITVTPGLVLAYVRGSRSRPYRVQVRLRTLGDSDWDRFLDAAVERPGHIAALLDGELPHSLADLADRGVPLLPGPGDLAPRCSCPDSGHPCKHAAALCYQTARLLDADPFVLLLLRGRGERALLDALSRRNAAREARAAQDRGPGPLPGVRAGAALTPRALPPLPAPLPAPPHPEQPPAYPAAPGGPDPFALDQLATDAAARAHALLTTGRDPVGGLTLWQDAVRLAAARPGSGLTAGTRALYASLASAAGRDTAELARAVAAWRQGGLAGLDVLEEPWDPPAGRFDRARPLLLAADLPAFRPWRNRLTHPRGHVQLRLGRTGLWYAYESELGREDWWPRGTPDLDPVGALTGLGGPGDP
ncbi:SWIM zinc finger family protein [Streptomyces coelicolor]|nr:MULTISPECIES: SWIM zinc finger family protein [Streptomyces]MDX2926417.1 SWIM zinc finger family protein [Streptomyces sp. NRRL_B-16638]TYP01045.1 putative Zn finger protein [Streptomyces coelicolor]TYP12103.1 putative Zn finger protein [Streptomyces coelicolor A3(2)]TYP21176.1 putative Zn finger protein [Streptomyces coelicolor]TYP21907.1 putative Zn finger protein [Streptomyces coelicolor]